MCLDIWVLRILCRDILWFNIDIGGFFFFFIILVIFVMFFNLYEGLIEFFWYRMGD